MLSIFFILTILGPFTDLAQADVGACLPVKAYGDIVDCAEKRSAEVQKATSELERQRLQESVANQLRNPEFSAEVVSGSNDSSETELSLAFPIEFGGKRSSRREVARANSERAEAALYEIKALVRLETILALHRLRQLKLEQALVDESLSAFDKLVKTYQGRPALSPEQNVTLSIFRIAKSDYMLKRDENEEKFAELEVFFKNKTGLSLDLVQKTLPPRMARWPEVEDKEPSMQSPRIKSLNAEVRAAQAELTQAQAERWPDLTVGPSVKLLREGGESSQMLGVNLSLPIPVFNVNEAGRASAAAGVSRSQLERNLESNNEANLRRQLVKNYRRTRASLQQVLSVEDIEKHHRNLDSQALRGLIPSALVIEAHRSLVDLEKTRNERELKALEALLKIYTIDGTILEQAL